MDHPRVRLGLVPLACGDPGIALRSLGAGYLFSITDAIAVVQWIRRKRSGAELCRAELLRSWPPGKIAGTERRFRAHYLWTPGECCNCLPGGLFISLSKQSAKITCSLMLPRFTESAWRIPC